MTVLRFRVNGVIRTVTLVEFARRNGFGADTDAAQGQIDRWLANRIAVREADGTLHMPYDVHPKHVEAFGDVAAASC